MEGTRFVAYNAKMEQLHVIPDTLPTLVPEADVKVKFSHNVEHEFRDWIAPGSILPTFAVEKPPVVQVQEFDKVEGNERLYTVLLVNPDTPDLEKLVFNYFTLCLSQCPVE